MVGITQNRSLQDEKLIETIFQTHLSLDSRQGHSSTTVYGATATNLIIDARPTTNAVANTAKGAGTENMDHYKGAKKAYLGIDNIHVMRDSLNKVVEALRDADTLAASINNDLAGDVKGLSLIDRQALRRSGWLRHISAILEGTRLITRNVHVNSSHVLIHCSDGWDRTSQLSSLTQICLDPFYRTMRGFAVLIEKDWLSFGFKFLDRCGHLSSEKFFVSPTETTVMGGGTGAEAAQAFLTSVQNRFASQHHVKETSPVFHQFLETVRQVQRQYPERFEYNERFLRQIHYHLYSCQFGTFLFNDERSRRNPDVGGGTPLYERTTSIWDWLLAPQERELNLNAEYNPALDDPASRAPKADMGVLMPNPKDIRFWNELYGRTDEEMNGRVVPAVATTAQQAATEVVGPISNGSEDPVLDIVTPAASSTPEEDDRVATPTLSTPVPSPPPTPAKSGQLQQQSGRASPARSVPQFERSDTQESFKPFDSTSSAISLRQPTAPLSSLGASAYTSAGRPPDLFGNMGGMKSMWGKLSSNASAAFSVVQDVYGGVARDMKGLTLSGEATGGQQLESSHDDLTTSWTGESSSAFAPSSPSQPSPRDTSSGVSRAGSFGSILPNPWATTSTATSTSSVARRSRSPIPSITGYDNPWGSIRASSAPDPHPSFFEIGGRDDPLLGGSIIGGPVNNIPAQTQPTLGAGMGESDDPLTQASLGNGDGTPASAFKVSNAGAVVAARRPSSSPRPQQAGGSESNSGGSSSMLDPLGVGLVS
jgi:myotubularin-related protein 6/7/8